jgi:hypothetical protein
MPPITAREWAECLQTRGQETRLRGKTSCSWERSKAIRWEMKKMFGKRYVDELISRSAENAADRLRFLKCARAAGLGPMALS